MKKNIFLLVFCAIFVLVASVAIAAEVPVIEGPIIATTCGQSPGAVMVKMSAMQAGFKAEHNNNLKPDDLICAEGYKTLIITTGTSMKGMGAAGTDVKQEIERCQALIKTAKEEGIFVIGAHVEGMARRTDQSDTASIEGVLPLSDMILVTVDSDSDGYFTKMAEEKNLPILIVKDALGIGTALAKTK